MAISLFSRLITLASIRRVSDRYEVLPPGFAGDELGWLDPEVAFRQHRAFMQLISEARRGNPRNDLLVAARAIEATGETDPLVLEVGAGSGYYSEALSLLLGHAIRYVGTDSSMAMMTLARATYPQHVFAAADATTLPLRSQSCDILLSGTSLMHILRYVDAINETARVTRRWAIFHTVPVMEKRSTTILRKLGYGLPMIELVFNRASLEGLICAAGFRIRESFHSIEYDLSHVVGERTWTVTYLCELGSGPRA